MAKVYYFHDEKNQTVVRIGPVYASAVWSNHRPPRYEGCDVRADSWSVSARWEKIEGLGYRYESGWPLYESYDARDSVERAEHWFIAAKMPQGSTEVTQEQYEQYAAAYRAAALAAGQPEPDPPPQRPAPPARRRRRRR